MQIRHPPKHRNYDTLFITHYIIDSLKFKIILEKTQRKDNSMNISTYFKIQTNGHKDLDFVDIDDVKDTKLFIDPYVIQALDDSLCSEAQRCIDSFFKELFIACKTRNLKRLRYLLKHASEPNETNLGMKTKSRYGKGSTAKELSVLFLEFYKLVSQNPNIESDPLALCMYIKNFDKDKMSDLITNIIRKQLYDFTLQQVNKYNVDLYNEPISLGYFWNPDLLTWEELRGKPLRTNQGTVLLVPKRIVRSRYVFNVEIYIKQYILTVLQKEHLDNQSDLCTKRESKNGKITIYPPTKKYLYEKEVNGTIHKDYAFNYSKENRITEEAFLTSVLKRIRNNEGKLSDDELDRIVYGNQFRVAS